jgi:hypothetical protein
MAADVFPKEGQGFRAEAKIGDDIHLVLTATHTAVGPVAAESNCTDGCFHLTRLCVTHAHALNYFIFVTGDRLCIYLNQGSPFYSSKQGRVQYPHGGCDMVKMRQAEEIHGLRCARVPVALKYSCIRPFIAGLGMSK